jgi:hypothetical protein
VKKKIKKMVDLNAVVRILRRGRDDYREAAGRCTCMDDKYLHICAETRCAQALDEAMELVLDLSPPKSKRKKRGEHG